MKFSLLILLSVINILLCAKTTKKPAEHKKIPCEGVHVHGKLHRRHVLMNGINRPYQLAMYHHKHIIYFSYNDGDDTEDTFGLAYIKINDTMPRTINGTKNGFAVTVDEHNAIVYFGGSNGVFADHLNKTEKLKHVIKDKDIWDMFYHEHHLYFIEFPSQRLHRYDTKKNETVLVKHIHEKIYQFAIDGDGDTFITTRDGLYEVKNTTRTLYTGPEIFRAIEVNHKGIAHFCAKSGIYVADKKNHTLTEIAKIKNIFGLTFDGDDNIIYSNPHEIVKLVPHDNKDCVN